MDSFLTYEEQKNWRKNDEAMKPAWQNDLRSLYWKLY